MIIHFDKDTIYCKYHRSFEKKETCERHCPYLCKSNGRLMQDYQCNEKEYFEDYFNARKSILVL